MDPNESLEELEKSITEMCEDVQPEISAPEKIEYDQLVCDIMKMCKQDGAAKEAQDHAAENICLHDGDNIVSESGKIENDNVYKHFAVWLSNNYNIPGTDKNDASSINMPTKVTTTLDSAKNVNASVANEKEYEITNHPGIGTVVEEQNNSGDLHKIELNPTKENDNVLLKMSTNSQFDHNPPITIISHKKEQKENFTAMTVTDECDDVNEETFAATGGKMELPMPSPDKEANKDESVLPKFSVSIEPLSIEMSLSIPKSPCINKPCNDELTQRSINSSVETQETKEDSNAALLIDSNFDGIEIDLDEMDVIDMVVENCNNDESEEQVTIVSTNPTHVGKSDDTTTYKIDESDPENKTYLGMQQSSVKINENEIRQISPPPVRNKITMNEPFVSDDPRENEDNNNPDWQITRMLESDDERYKAVRKKWKNLMIPDPNLNLTTHNYRMMKQHNSNVNATNQQTERRRKRSASSESVPGNKRKKMRTASCTDILDDQIKKLDDELKQVKKSYAEQFYELRNQIYLNRVIRLEQLNQQERMYSTLFNSMQLCDLRKAISLERYLAHEQHSKDMSDLQRQYNLNLNSVHNQYEKEKDLLSNTREEIFTFHRFYSGLKNSSNENVDATVFTETRQKEIMEIDKIYKEYHKFYT